MSPSREAAKNPIWHSQPADPALTCAFSTHSEHPVEPVAEYSLSLHLVHLLASATAEYRPVAQSSHSCVGFGEKRPGVHDFGCVLPSGQETPARHCSISEGSMQNEPAGQGEVWVVPGAAGSYWSFSLLPGQYSPSAQGFFCVGSLHTLPAGQRMRGAAPPAQ